MIQHAATQSTQYIRQILSHDQVQRFIYDRRYGKSNAINELKQTLVYSFRPAKKLAIAIIGGCVLLLGIAFIILPGPAIIVIPAGLAILAVEFNWAQRYLKTVRQKIDELMSRWRK